MDFMAQHSAGPNHTQNWNEAFYRPSDFHMSNHGQWGIQTGGILIAVRTLNACPPNTPDHL